MARTLTIGTDKIGDETPCYVIAEIGHNHQGSVEKAHELFREAKLAGAHAVKLQKRDNRSLYTQAAYDRPYDNENSFGSTYGEHREFLEFGLREYEELQAYAGELKIDFFATAFDIASADFLESLGVPAFKIASGDLRSIPLIQHVRSLRQTDHPLDGRSAPGGRAASIRGRPADQRSLGYSAVHGRLSSGVRGTRSSGHRNLSRLVSRCCDRVLEPRQRHLDAGRSVHAGCPNHREAFHAESSDEGNRSRVLSRARRAPKDGA